MFPRNALDLFEQTRIWHWPWLFIQLVQLWQWMRETNERLGERVSIQFGVYEGRIFIVRMSDNVSGAKPDTPWTCGAYSDLAHLTEAPGAAPLPPIQRANTRLIYASPRAILHIAPG